VLLVRSLPIDSLTLGTSEEILLLMEDEVWDLPLCLLRGDLIKKGIADEAPGEKLLFI
jgi:hypothetical protein